MELMHVVPVGAPSNVTKRPHHAVSPLLGCTVHVSESGKEQYSRLIQLAYIHHSLASTTVTGIPMKVPQAFQMLNYNNELVNTYWKLILAT